MTRGAATADVGLIGLGVMGRSFALNLADHGRAVAVYNRTASVTERFVTEHPATPGGLVACATVDELVRALRRPRIVILLVAVGPPVDAFIEQLLAAGLEPGDVVVDCGNSQWTDTRQRAARYAGRCRFVGSGISGGEVGARFGPSLMPGGDRAAWDALRPLWEAVAARVDGETGQPLEGAAPGRPVTGGEPCTAWIGPDGAGHHVKMVHNGIEYAVMQAIGETYHLLAQVGRLAPDEAAAVFAEWNRGDLASYLAQITAEVLRQRDPTDPRRFLVDVVLDAAEQKGTGRWTVMNALELGVPAPTIAEAVFARSLSALRAQRLEAARTLAGPARRTRVARARLVQIAGRALHGAAVSAYAEGFQLMRAAGEAYGWPLDLGAIAGIWRGGCIIRARLLHAIMAAYRRNPELPHLMLDPDLAAALRSDQEGWRETVALAARSGIPTPALSSALAAYDGHRAERLPASLLQLQRDYFGAHTFERLDSPRGTAFHVTWPEPERRQHEA
jgi:6-phosphogluconate dehydrogenase